MFASNTSSTTSYSRAGSPSVDELLADLEASVAAPPTYHDDTVYRPQTPSRLTAHMELAIDPEVPLWANRLTAPITDRDVPLDALKRSLPPVKFTTLGNLKDMGHPQGFDFSAFGEASRSPCIQWDADLVFMSQRPSGAVEERFVVNSGTAFGVEGYQDICYLAQKRKADEDVDMDADTEHVVEEMRKKHKVDKSPSRRNPRKATTASPSPAKGATPKSTPKPASRKSTPTPAPRKPNPRSQTSQRSAVAGPSASIPGWQTRWTTEAEKTIIMEA